MKSLFVMLMSGLLLSGLGFAQTTTISGTATKRCAFDLKPQPTWKSEKSKPPTARQLFDDLGSDPTLPAFTNTIANYASPRPRYSCPYERAIELFGQDRVRFEESGVGGDPPKQVKRILVDDEEVYREEVK